jgi:hypothetical protein
MNVGVFISECLCDFNQCLLLRTDIGTVNAKLMI